ncbi:MAG: hypothetical protein O3B01_01635 [Planctomycetota bacterium]|nr:hypothetical protein [Planctomycetota bacterium]
MAAALAGASFVLVLIVYQRVIGLENRIARLSRLDAKLDAVLKHLEIDFNPSEGISDEIIEALKRGDKIQAAREAATPTSRSRTKQT